MTTPADRASTHAHFILDTIQPEDRHALDGLLDHLLNGVAYCRMEYRNGRPHDFRYL